MKIEECLKQLAEARKKIAAIDDLKAKATQDLNAAKDQVYAVLKEIGLKSAKTDDFTASIATRNSMKVTHQPSVMEWLENEPNIEPDLYLQLNKTALEPLVKQALKENGEIVPGIEFESTEYISLRTNKK